MTENSASMADEILRPEVPEGWIVSRLGDGLVYDVQPGFACGTHNQEGQGVPHIRPMNVTQDGRISLENLRFVPKAVVDRDERRLRHGDVVFNNTNSPELVGKTALYDLPESRAFSNHMTRLRCHEEVLYPAYCAMYLHQKWREGYFEAACNNHVSQASVSRAVLLETPILLPPLADQKRIVAKVEELSAKVNAAREGMARVPAILKRFRQSVLAAACSGRLTADWRQTRARGGSWSRKKFEVEQPTETLQSLPEEWAWSDVGTVCNEIVDCPHSTPKWTREGVLCLRTTNFRPGYLDLRDVRFVSEETYRQRTARLEPRAGDVVYSREGGILGIASLMPRGIRACLGQRMMLLRPRNSMLPAFLGHVLNSPLTIRLVECLTGGTASPHLNVTEIKQFPVPVPNPQEQEEIVRRTKALFCLVDAIERREAAAAGRVGNVAQAVLAKAFRGELVPTEAGLARTGDRFYEPAPTLLARIDAPEKNAIATKRTSV